MLVIGLTGSIGSGKTTASELFSQKDIPIINADTIARQLLDIDTPEYHKVIAHFGKDIINEDKSLNRGKIRKIIFANQQQKIWLEQLLHPQIKLSINNSIISLKHKQPAPSYCIVEIPLLKDKANYPMLDRMLLIDCNQKTQIERVTNRDNCSEDLIHSIIASHPAIDKRRKNADDIIENNGTLDELKQKIEKQHKLYSQLSHPN